MQKSKIYILAGWGYLSLGHNDAYSMATVTYQYGSANELKKIFPGFGAVLEIDDSGIKAFSANDVLEALNKKFPNYHNCILVHYPNGMYQLFCDDRIGQNDRASIFNTIPYFFKSINS